MDNLELTLWLFTVYYFAGLVITSFIALRGMRKEKVQPSSLSSGMVALLIVSCVAPLIILSATVGDVVRVLRGK